MFDELANLDGGRGRARALLGASSGLARAWARYGQSEAGWPDYQRLLERTDGQLTPLEGQSARPTAPRRSRSRARCCSARRSTRSSRGGGRRRNGGGAPHPPHRRSRRRRRSPPSGP